jgi:cytochrome c peroxidase
MRKFILVGACAAAWLFACSDDDSAATSDSGAVQPVDAAVPSSDSSVTDASAPDARNPDASDPNDGFTDAEWATFRTLSPMAAKPPADTTNKYADSPAAAALGQMFFYDPAFSGPIVVASNGTNGGLGDVGQVGKVACVSCHSGQGTEDSRSKPNNVSLGTNYGTRNALALIDSSYQTWTNWGGRFDSQWSLAPAVSENPATMNGTRLRTVHVIYDKYKTEYEAVFGALDPAIADTARFPLEGKGGQPSWDDMDAADKTTAMRVFANFGKAIAAYVRLLVSKNAPFDRYVAGDRTALDDAQKRGLRAFVGKGACVSCHSGPAFTDGKFHALAVPQVGANVAATDLGRNQDVPALLASPFNVNGPYSDDTTTTKLTGLAQTDAQKGQFRTPGLRGVARTGPYMHTGAFPTLAEVVAYYDKGGADPGDAGIVKDPLFKPLGLQGTEGADLVRFLESLSGEALPANLLRDTHKP